LHFFIPFWLLRRHGSGIVIMPGAFVGKRVGFLVGAVVVAGAFVVDGAFVGAFVGARQAGKGAKG
jgi:hypothetical protein